MLFRKSIIALILCQVSISLHAQKTISQYQQNVKVLSETENKVNKTITNSAELESLVEVDNAGKANVSIPVFTVEGRNLKIPISLNYQSGIKVDQKSSEVGLGWSINFGSITRNYGAFEPDYTSTEAEAYYTLHPQFQLESPHEGQTTTFNETKIMTHQGFNPHYSGLEPTSQYQPDEYLISAPGLGSNSFFNKGGQGNSLNFALTNVQPWKIEYDHNVFTVAQEWSSINEIPTVALTLPNREVSIHNKHSLAAAIIIPPYVSDRYFGHNDLLADCDPITDYPTYDNLVKYRDFNCFAITDKDGTKYIFGRALRAQKYFVSENPFWSTLTQGQIDAMGTNVSINLCYGEFWKIDYIAEWLLTEVRSADYFDKNGNGFADDGDYGDWVRFEYTDPTEVKPNGAYTSFGPDNDYMAKHREWVNFTQTDQASSIWRERAYVTKIVTPIKTYDFTISKKMDVDFDYFETCENYFRSITPPQRIYDSEDQSTGERYKVKYPMELMRYDDVVVSNKMKNIKIQKIQFVYAAKGSADELAVSEYLIRKNDYTEQSKNFYSKDGPGNFCIKAYNTGEKRGKTTLKGISTYKYTNNVIDVSDKQSYLFTYGYNPSFSNIHKREILRNRFFPTTRQSRTKSDRPEHIMFDDSPSDCNPGNFNKDLSSISLLSDYAFEAKESYYNFADQNEVFDYLDNGVSSSMPDILHRTKYNGARAYRNNLDYYFDQDDENTSCDGIDAWSLTKITNPLKGEISIEYEKGEINLVEDKAGWLYPNPSSEVLNGVSYAGDVELPNIGAYNKLAKERTIRQDAVNRAIEFNGIEPLTGNPTCTWPFSLCSESFEDFWNREILDPKELYREFYMSLTDDDVMARVHKKKIKTFLNPDVEITYAYSEPINRNIPFTFLSNKYNTFSSFIRMERTRHSWEEEKYSDCYLNFQGFIPVDYSQWGMVIYNRPHAFDRVSDNFYYGKIEEHFSDGSYIKNSYSNPRNSAKKYLKSYYNLAKGFYKANQLFQKVVITNEVDNANPIVLSKQEFFKASQPTPYITVNNSYSVNPNTGDAVDIDWEWGDLTDVAHPLHQHFIQGNKYTIWGIIAQRKSSGSWTYHYPFDFQNLTNEPFASLEISNCPNAEDDEGCLSGVDGVHIDIQLTVGFTINICNNPNQFLGVADANNTMPPSFTELTKLTNMLYTEDDLFLPLDLTYRYLPTLIQQTQKSTINRGLTTIEDYTYEPTYNLLKTVKRSSSAKTINSTAAPNDIITEYKYLFEEHPGTINTPWIFLYNYIHNIGAIFAEKTYLNSVSTSNLIGIKCHDYHTDNISNNIIVPYWGLRPKQSYTYNGDVDGQGIISGTVPYTDFNDRRWLPEPYNDQNNKYGKSILNHLDNIYARSVPGYRSEVSKGQILWNKEWFDATYTGFEDLEDQKGGYEVPDEENCQILFAYTGPPKYVFNEEDIPEGYSECGLTNHLIANHNGALNYADIVIPGDENSNVLGLEDGDEIRIVANPSMLSDCGSYIHNLPDFVSFTAKVNHIKRYDATSSMVLCFEEGLGVSPITANVGNNYHAALCLDQPIPNNLYTGCTIYKVAGAVENNYIATEDEQWILRDVEAEPRDIENAAKAHTGTWVYKLSSERWLNSKTAKTPVRPVLVKKKATGITCNFTVTKATTAPVVINSGFAYKMTAAQAEEVSNAPMFENNTFITFSPSIYASLYKTERDSDDVINQRLYNDEDNDISALYSDSIASDEVLMFYEDSEGAREDAEAELRKFDVTNYPITPLVLDNNCDMPYIASVWARKDIGTQVLNKAKFHYAIYDANRNIIPEGGTLLYTGYKLISNLNDQWKYFEMEIPVRKRDIDIYIEVWLEVDATNEGALLFDDLLVYPKGARYNYQSFDKFRNITHSTNANDVFVKVDFDDWGRNIAAYDANAELLGSTQYKITNNLLAEHNWVNVKTFVDNTHYSESRTFMDGIGAAKQVAVKVPSENYTRFINTVETDSRGRINKAYLSYPKVGITLPVKSDNTYNTILGTIYGANSHYYTENNYASEPEVFVSKVIKPYDNTETAIEVENEEAATTGSLSFSFTDEYASGPPSYTYSYSSAELLEKKLKNEVGNYNYKYYDKHGLLICQKNPIGYDYSPTSTGAIVFNTGSTYQWAYTYFVYYPNGQLKYSIDPEGKVTKYEYTASGLPKAKYTTDEGSMYARYDKFGRERLKQDAADLHAIDDNQFDDIFTYNTYDTWNRVSDIGKLKLPVGTTAVFDNTTNIDNKVYPAQTLANVERHKHYEYDGAKLHNLIDNVYSETTYSQHTFASSVYTPGKTDFVRYRYDRNGRLKEKIFKYGEFVNPHTIVYTYNRAGGITEWRYIHAVNHDYDFVRQNQFDDLGNVVRALSGRTYATLQEDARYQYDGLGHLKKKGLGKSAALPSNSPNLYTDYISYSYDIRGQTKEQISKRFRYLLEYDKKGLITKQTWGNTKFDGGSPYHHNIYDYYYDDLNRLVGADYSDLHTNNNPYLPHSVSGNVFQPVVTCAGPTLNPTLGPTIGGDWTVHGPSPTGGGHKMKAAFNNSLKMEMARIATLNAAGLITEGLADTMMEEHVHKMLLDIDLADSINTEAMRMFVGVDRFGVPTDIEADMASFRSYVEVLNADVILQMDSENNDTVTNAEGIYTQYVASREIVEGFADALAEGGTDTALRFRLMDQFCENAFDIDFSRYEINFVKPWGFGAGCRIDYSALATNTITVPFVNPVITPTRKYDTYYRYDKVGNFTNLERYDNLTNLDQYAYNYASGRNILASVNTIYTPVSGSVVNDTRLYKYDPKGNLTEDAFSEVDDITYDPFSRAAKIEKTNGDIFKYRYDINGTRSIKDKGDGIMEYYLDDVILDENQKPVRYSLDEGFVTIDYINDIAVRYYEIKDWLGTVRATLERHGSSLAPTIISVRDHYPFGKIMPGRNYESDAEALRNQFTGHEHDGETEYDYHGARYYNRDIGRYMSVDPLAGKYVSWGTYTYVLDNPIIAVDPDGKDVYILIYTIKAPEFKQAAEFRADAIRNQPGYDKSKDNVYMIALPDFDDIHSKLNEVIEDANANAYGKTVELGIWSHSGFDGPVADKYTERLEGGTQYAEDKQLSPATWSSIDFNFDPNNSTASFYGCRSSNFADKFLSLQPTLYQSTGNSAYTYPSTNPYKWVYPKEGEKANYYVGVKGLNPNFNRIIGMKLYTVPMSVFRRDGTRTTASPNVNTQTPANTKSRTRIIDKNTTQTDAAH